LEVQLKPHKIRILFAVLHLEIFISAWRDNMKNIGNVIMRRRKELHLTQSDLGEKLGVSKSYICQIESGFRPVNIEKAQAIGTVLGIDIYDYVQAENALLNKWKDVIKTFEDHDITPDEIRNLIGFINHLKTG
jgi:transcriptional regulator with XRE-family HTH domain